MKTASSIELYMLGLINAGRKEHGLKPLVLERNLNGSAESYSKTLLDKGHFSHTGPDGSSAKGRIAEARFDMTGDWSIGENLAAGTLAGGDIRADVDMLHEGLMNSPGHRANLLTNKYTHVGIGIEIGDYDPFSGRPTMMITQNFGASTGVLDVQLQGTSRNDRLDGGTGDDRVAGSSGHDRISGGNGKDSLYGGSGKDRIYGDAGSDKLYGESGNDKLYGGSGSDTISGGTGHDRIKGGSGNDAVYGGSGNDKLYGESGKDKLYGGSGGDRISGGSGNDKIYGESGRDRIDGGAGNDRLYGGSGSDTFIFRAGSDTDRIYDFDAGFDRLKLDANLWSDRMTESQVLRSFGKETDEGVEFDFGEDRLILLGVDSILDLADRIDFF